MDIYLDQNHWIALARAYHGQETSSDVAEASRLATAAVAANKARFPVSSVHLIEAAKIPDDERRKRFAEAFLHFSRGWVAAPLDFVVGEELIRWHRGELPRADNAIRRGILSAFASYGDAAIALGVTPAEVQLEDALGDNAGAWMHVLSDPAIRDAAPAIHASAEGYAQRVVSVRDEWLELPPPERIATYALGVLDDLRGTTKPQSEEVEKAIQRLEREVPSAPYSAIPSIDVLVTLGDVVCRDRARPTDKNDLWDLAFLAVAIPYFDAVVTERSWAHHANASGLARKYSCQVLSRTEELRSLLHSLDA